MIEIGAESAASSTPDGDEAVTTPTGGDHPH
jgi:hypothetical protein